MCSPCSLIYFGESAFADFFKPGSRCCCCCFWTQEPGLLLPLPHHLSQHCSFLWIFFSLGLENLVTLKTEENVSSVTFFPHALVKVCFQYSMWVYYSVSLRNIYKSLNGLNLLLNLASSFTFSRNSILCSILVFLSLFLWVKGFVFPVYYSGFCLVG